MATDVDTTQHDWRQWTMAPVTPMGEMRDGSPAVVQNLDGESETKIFCMRCMVGLTNETADTMCPGETDDEEEETDDGSVDLDD